MGMSLNNKVRCIHYFDVDGRMLFSYANVTVFLSDLAVGGHK